MFAISRITNHENICHLKLVIDHNSNRVNDLLIKNTILFTLHGNMLTFRDTGEKFELKGDLLKMITNKYCNVDLASLLDENQMYAFAIERNFDVRS